MNYDLSLQLKLRHGTRLYLQPHWEVYDTLSQQLSKLDSKQLRTSHHDVYEASGGPSENP